MPRPEPMGRCMRRREFLGALSGAAAVWPLAARAQQSATKQRIAIFHPAIPVALLTETGGGSAWRAFFGELRRLVYVEGQNLIIERYSAEGHHERYADLARQIVAHNPDVMVTSLGRPGSNLTGITLDPGIEIWGKRLEMLKEAVPSATKAAFLGMREGW